VRNSKTIAKLFTCRMVCKNYAVLTSLAKKGSLLLRTTILYCKCLRGSYDSLIAIAFIHIFSDSEKIIC